jgi:adenosylhomocysteinase
MDMSFANQALVAEWLWQNPKLIPGVHMVPEKIDRTVANLKLEGAGIKIDRLSEQQEKYMKSWLEGTE